MISASQIPDEVVEAAAIAAMKDNGCGYTVNGKHVLCDDPVCEGLIDAYGKPLLHECSCRSMARASITAALNAWPGSYSLAENDSAEIRGVAAIILPVPLEASDE